MTDEGYDKRAAGDRPYYGRRCAEMNRQQRRAQARQPGETYADRIARREIGRQTLRMAMEDEAVKLAADIICQRQLWAVVVTLNERYQFGPKRTRDFFEAMEKVLEEFEAMKKENGDTYAEEKLRKRAEQVSGVKIRYQHEQAREFYEQDKKGEEV